LGLSQGEKKSWHSAISPAVFAVLGSLSERRNPDILKSLLQSLQFWVLSVREESVTFLQPLLQLLQFWDLLVRGDSLTVFWLSSLGLQSLQFWLVSIREAGILDCLLQSFGPCSSTFLYPWEV
jgi:hypothetical protein